MTLLVLLTSDSMLDGFGMFGCLSFKSQIPSCEFSTIFQISLDSRLPSEEILASLGLGAIDLLKIDCEGCEWEILDRWDLLNHLFGHVSLELHNRALVQ